MEGAKEVGWCGSRVIEWGWNRRGGLGRWKGKVDPSKMTGCIRLLRVHNMRCITFVTTAYITCARRGCNWNTVVWMVTSAYPSSRLMNNPFCDIIAIKCLALTANMFVVCSTAASQCKPQCDQSTCTCRLLRGLQTVRRHHRSRAQLIKYRRVNSCRRVRACRL